jgi:hypothetical protein
MVDNDSAVLWTFERMMKKTDDYVVRVEGELVGFWLTEQAYQDVQKALENVN